MTFQQITAAIPGPPDEGGVDREWICLLSCGHEARLQGRVGRPPKKGRAFALCRACELVALRDDLQEMIKEEEKLCEEADRAVREGGYKS